MFRSAVAHRIALASWTPLMLALVLGSALPALAAAGSPSAGSSSPGASSPGPDLGGAGDQVVLLGRVVVARGQSVGEVVVFSGHVIVEGVVRGDVVVFEGPITVSGQVSGSVIALGGSVRLQEGAQVGGDVLAHDAVGVQDGVRVAGAIREHVAFNLSGLLTAAGVFLPWLAVAVSTLILGLLFSFLAPQALDRTAAAGRTAPWPCAGWGVALAIGSPVLSTVLVASILGSPLGLATLLAIAPLAFIGVVMTAHLVGRLVLGQERATATAYLAGWGVATVVGVIPFVSGVAFGLAAVFGLGEALVAVWRARAPERSGRHRARPTGRARTSSSS
jgi:cytoskeletal protein CcmA (bactofilin family)